VVKDEVLQRVMGVRTRDLFEYRQIGMVGAFMSAPPTTAPTRRTG
jgi:hydroxymethylglutaryl-CoA reductase (NADPH)